MTQRGDGKENKKLKLKRVSLDLDIYIAVKYLQRPLD